MSLDATQATDTARRPSPSTIAYLFADRFVITEKAGKVGQRAWGTGAVVVTAELASGLVAIALWQLREMGALSLEAYSAKRLGFISTSGVRVLPTGTTPEVGGVEKAAITYLLGTKRGREGKETAFDVANMLCREGKDPRGVIIRMAMDEAVELGYLDRIKEEVGVVGRLSGKPSSRLEAHPERLETLRADAERLAVQWKEFRQGPEAEMVKLLRSTTYDGIDTRARSSRDDD